jgi:hypothetical protein
LKLGNKAVAATFVAGVMLSMAAPALAEGVWSSSIWHFRTGNDSRHWQDSHLDSAHTTTSFDNCDVFDGALAFQSAKLSLYDDMGLFPDYNVGTKKNYCGTIDWGIMTRPDEYHWTVDEINGDISGWYFNVAKVVQHY